MYLHGFLILCASGKPGICNSYAHILLTMQAGEKGKWLPKYRKGYDLDENDKKIRLPSVRFSAPTVSSVSEERDWHKPVRIASSSSIISILFINKFSLCLASTILCPSGEKGKWLPKYRKVYDLDENDKKIRLPSDRTLYVLRWYFPKKDKRK